MKNSLGKRSQFNLSYNVKEFIDEGKDVIRLRIYCRI